MYLKKLIVMLLLIPVFFSGGYAQNEDAGTSSPFALGSGGRIISMGGAGASLGGSSFSLHWNPSNLYGLDRGEVNIFHTSLFDQSVGYSSLFASYPFLDFGIISAGAMQLRIDGIERRNSENMILEGKLDNVQTRYMIGYARKIYSDLAGGITMKLDRYTQGSYIANGFGMDIGLSVKTRLQSPLVDGMSAGFALANIIEPKITLVSEESGDPTAFRLGVSFWRGISGRLEDRFLVSADIGKNRYSETHFHLGGEYRIADMVSVRGGWGEGIPTFGCGVEAGDFVVDYAYRSTDLGGNHLFSVIYNFGTSRSERINRRREKRAKELQVQVEKQMAGYEKRFIRSSLEKGNRNLQRGNYSEAVEHFQRVLLWDPDNKEARSNIRIAEASLNVLEGDSLASLSHYGEALFQYRKAYHYLQAPEIKKKMERCEKKLGEATDKRKMINQLFSRALEYYTSRRWDEAVKAFQEVLKLDHRHPLAESYLEKTHQKIENSRKRIMKQAQSLVSRKRYSAAIDILQKGKQQFPADSIINNRLEQIRSIRERMQAEQDPVVEREESASRKPPPAEMEKLRASFERGISFFREGNFAMAIREWEKVWQVYPGFDKIEDYLVKSYQYLGMEYYARHKYKEALETWKKILVIRPEHAKAARYINRTREELDKLKGLKD